MPKFEKRSRSSSAFATISVQKNFFCGTPSSFPSSTYLVSKLLFVTLLSTQLNTFFFSNFSFVLLNAQFSLH